MVLLLLLLLRTLNRFVLRDYHCHDCSCLGHGSCPSFSMSRLPLLPLSDRVLVVVVAAVVVSQLHLEGRTSW